MVNTVKEELLKRFGSEKILIPIPTSDDYIDEHIPKKCVGCIHLATDDCSSVSMDDKCPEYEKNQQKHEMDIILTRWISGEMSNSHEVMKATSVMLLDRLDSKDRTLAEKLFEDLSMLSYLTIIYGPIKLKRMIDTAVTMDNIMYEMHKMADGYWNNKINKEVNKEFEDDINKEFAAEFEKEIESENSDGI